MARFTRGVRTVCVAVLVLVALDMAGAGSAHAQMTPEMRSLNDRIDRLTRELNAVQAQLNSGAVAPAGPDGAAGGGSIAAQFEVRISQLEAQMRELNGKIEEANFGVSQLRQRVERMSTDTDFRLQAIEKAQADAATATATATAKTEAATETARGGDTQGPGAPPRNLGTISEKDSTTAPLSKSAKEKQAKSKEPEPVAPTVTLPAGGPKDQYDFAFDLLIRAQYPEAEQALKQFITAHPTDPLTPNAQYWLGESFFARKNYADAAANFLIGYQKYPQSPKAADNLLKLGLSLQNLNKKAEACTAYGRFAKEYPNASVTLKRRVLEERQRLNCS